MTLQTAVWTEPKMSVMKLSRWKPNLEKKFSIQSVKGSFQIDYYCLYIILFVPI